MITYMMSPIRSLIEPPVEPSVEPLAEPQGEPPVVPPMDPPVDPPKRQIERDVDVLARTIYGEARGELVRGQEAVAAVVINRVRRARQRSGRYWWGSSIEEVCLKPWQFSCWNSNDTNRQKIETVTADNEIFQTCLRVARRAVSGVLKDPTCGATHYHVTGLQPAWSRRRAPSAEIGNHQFYNDVE